MANEELSQESKNEKIRISTCFVGGGTPSVLNMEQTEKLLKSINKYYQSREIEFTIECNPGTVTKEKLLLYRKYGVNRLSFGLQSADCLQMYRRLTKNGRFSKIWRC